MYPDKAVRREISALEVYCPHSNTGCDWTGPLHSVEEHAAQCPHKRVRCPNSGCGLVTTAALLNQHLEECLYREAKCRHCMALLPFCHLAVCYCTCSPETQISQYTGKFLHSIICDQASKKRCYSAVIKVLRNCKLCKVLYSLLATGLSQDVASYVTSEMLSIVGERERTVGICIDTFSIYGI